LKSLAAADIITAVAKSSRGRLQQGHAGCEYQNTKRMRASAAYGSINRPNRSLQLWFAQTNNLNH
jgi:hypothetical protein